MVEQETPKDSRKKSLAYDILKIILIFLTLYLSITAIISFIGYFDLLPSLSEYLKYLIFKSETPTEDYYFWAFCLSFAGLALVILLQVFVIKMCLI